MKSLLLSNGSKLVIIPSCLLKVVEEVKKLGKIEEEKVLTGFLHHFVLENFSTNSSILECIIEAIYNTSVWINVDEIDDEDRFHIRFKK